MDILEAIDDISDPRMAGKVRHKLSTILFVALCGILSGCESWSDIQDYCRAKKDFLSKYICLDNGIPSGSTLRRVFILLNPDNVEHLLRTHASKIVHHNKPSDQIRCRWQGFTR